MRQKHLIDIVVGMNFKAQWPGEKLQSRFLEDDYDWIIVAIANHFCSTFRCAKRN
jgi:hypothetical protein